MLDLTEFRQNGAVPKEGHSISGVSQIVYNPAVPLPVGVVVSIITFLDNPVMVYGFRPGVTV